MEKQNNAKENKKLAVITIITLIIATVFVSLFSRTTSPFYGVHIGFDSPIFETIGKYWARGIVPYTELFDHKGPFIFFINMLGYKITNSGIGVFFLQIFFLSITIAAIYKIVALEVADKSKRVIFTLLALLVLTLTYDEGNLTEEYVLPFLCICVYGQLKYIVNQKGIGQHSYSWSVIYGGTFAVCLLTRITNAIGLLSGIVVLTIILIRNKQYKNLLFNMISFILGFLIVILPFIVYFYSKGALEEFYFGTIGFNLEYTENTTFWWQKGKFFMYLKIWTIRFFSVYGMFLPAILAFFRKKYNKAVWILLIALAETIFFVQGNLYPHYATIALSNFVIILQEISLWQPKRKPIKRIIKFFLFLYVIVASLYCIKDNLKSYRNAQDYIPEYHKLMQQIPTEERDQFVAYQTDRNIYLQYDIKPYYPYFILQESQGKYSERLKREIYDTYNQGDAKWILMKEGQGVIIKDIINSRYSEFANDNGYSLYQLNEK